MYNTTLIRVLGLIGGLYIIALVLMMIFYDGDKVIAGTLLSGAVGVLVPSLLSLKQSADNATAIEKTIAKVDDNTETTNTTHDLVNSQTDAYKKLMKDQADMKVAMVEMQARLDSAMARADGIAEGRSQMTIEGAQVSIAGPDGTIEVKAPAIIEVKAPELAP